MRRIHFVLYLLCGLIILLVSCQQTKLSTEMKIAPFSFVNQYDESFGTSELSGSLWVASFIFTNCETVCPPMMLEMAALQDKVQSSDVDVQFVSFTVDPVVDTPEVLRAYVKQFTTNDTNWHLLTGYTQDEIERFALEQFQTIVQKPDSSEQVIHGTNFYLVNKAGYIVNEYNYVDETEMEQLVYDIIGHAK